MRLALALPLAAMALVATPAKAQLYVTGVTATFPDPNGKVPAFNAVACAGIPTLSTGFSQAVLTHGQSYNFCVTLASAEANGEAQVSFSLKRGKLLILGGVIIKRPEYKVSANGVWFYCSGYKSTPDSPGAAILTGTSSYLASGATKSVTSHVSVPVLIE